MLTPAECVSTVGTCKNLLEMADELLVTLQQFTEQTTTYIRTFHSITCPYLTTYDDVLMLAGVRQ